MNKLYAMLVTAVVSLAAAYFYYSPYMYLSEFQRAVAEKDQTALDELVDFASVRSGLKEQMKVAMAEKMDRELKDNPFALMAGLMAEAMVDRFVDSFVTPAGLANLSTSEDSDGDIMKANFEYERKGLNRVDIYPDSETSYFVIKRSGFATWRMTNIYVDTTQVL